MASAGEVLIKEAGVYLYAHAAEDNELIETVQRALKKKLNWDDPPYLARRIFLAMTVGYNEEEFGGFGISKYSTGPSILITVNCRKQLITMKRFLGFEDGLKRMGILEELESNPGKYDEESTLRKSRIIRTYTFEEFCNSETKSLYYDDSE